MENTEFREREYPGRSWKISEESPLHDIAEMKRGFISFLGRYEPTGKFTLPKTLDNLARKNPNFKMSIKVGHNGEFRCDLSTAKQTTSFSFSSQEKLDYSFGKFVTTQEKISPTPVREDVEEVIEEDPKNEIVFEKKLIEQSEFIFAPRLVELFVANGSSIEGARSIKTFLIDRLEKLKEVDYELKISVGKYYINLTIQNDKGVSAKFPIRISKIESDYFDVYKKFPGFENVINRFLEKLEKAKAEDFIEEDPENEITFKKTDHLFTSDDFINLFLSNDIPLNVTKKIAFFLETKLTRLKNANYELKISFARNYLIDFTLQNDKGIKETSSLSLLGIDNFNPQLESEGFDHTINRFLRSSEEGKTEDIVEENPDVETISFDPEKDKFSDFKINFLNFLRKGRMILDKDAENIFLGLKRTFQQYGDRKISIERELFTTENDTNALKITLTNDGFEPKSLIITRQNPEKLIDAMRYFSGEKEDKENTPDIPSFETPLVDDISAWSFGEYLQQFVEQGIINAEKAEASIKDLEWFIGNYGGKLAAHRVKFTFDKNRKEFTVVLKDTKTGNSKEGELHETETLSDLLPYLKTLLETENSETPPYERNFLNAQIIQTFEPYLWKSLGLEPQKCDNLGMLLTRFIEDNEEDLEGIKFKFHKTKDSFHIELTDPSTGNSTTIDYEDFLQFGASLKKAWEELKEKNNETPSLAIPIARGTNIPRLGKTLAKFGATLEEFDPQATISISPRDFDLSQLQSLLTHYAGEVITCDDKATIFKAFRDVLLDFVPKESLEIIVEPVDKNHVNKMKVSCKGHSFFFNFSCINHDNPYPTRLKHDLVSLLEKVNVEEKQDLKTILSLADDDCAYKFRTFLNNFTDDPSFLDDIESEMSIFLADVDNDDEIDPNDYSLILNGDKVTLTIRNNVNGKSDLVACNKASEFGKKLLNMIGSLGDGYETKEEKSEATKELSSFDLSTEEGIKSFVNFISKDRFYTPRDVSEITKNIPYMFMKIPKGCTFQIKCFDSHIFDLSIGNKTRTINANDLMLFNFREEFDEEIEKIGEGKQQENYEREINPKLKALTEAVLEMKEGKEFSFEEFKSIGRFLEKNLTDRSSASNLWRIFGSVQSKIIDPSSAKFKIKIKDGRKVKITIGSGHFSFYADQGSEKVFLKNLKKAGAKIDGREKEDNIFSLSETEEIEHFLSKGLLLNPMRVRGILESIDKIKNTIREEVEPTIELKADDFVLWLSHSNYKKIPINSLARGHISGLLSLLEEEGYGEISREDTIKFLVDHLSSPPTHSFRTDFEANEARKMAKKIANLENQLPGAREIMNFFDEYGDNLKERIMRWLTEVIAMIPDGTSASVKKTRQNSKTLFIIKVGQETFNLLHDDIAYGEGFERIKRRLELKKPISKAVETKGVPQWQVFLNVMKQTVKKSKQPNGKWLIKYQSLEIEFTEEELNELFKKARNAPEAEQVLKDLMEGKYEKEITMGKRLLDELNTFLLTLPTGFSEEKIKFVVDVRDGSDNKVCGLGLSDTKMKLYALRRKFEENPAGFFTYINNLAKQSGFEKIVEVL